MVRFDSGCRVFDVLRKLVSVTGSSVGTDGEMLFSLFLGNEPLDEDATLAELNLNDRVCGSFGCFVAYQCPPQLV
jgi:hypothetical protein